MERIKIMRFLKKLQYENGDFQIWNKYTTLFRISFQHSYAKGLYHHLIAPPKYYTSESYLYKLMGKFSKV